MEENWRIDTFYIGLPSAGDGHIHLLCKYGDLDDRATVHWAMLVDGGQHENTVSYLEHAIAQVSLSPNYDFRPLNEKGTDNLTFNVVVITHWDRDHYDGLFMALRQDIYEQYPDEGTDISNAKVSYFQYRDGVGNQPRTPLTTLYCPAYAYRGGATKKTFPRLDTMDTDDDGHRRRIFSSGFWLQRPGEYQNENEVRVLNLVNIFMEPSQAPEGVVRTVIGMNLITQTFLYPDVGQTTDQLVRSLTSPALLIARNPPEHDIQPGVYVISASERTIGNQPPPNLDDTARKPDEVGVIRTKRNGLAKNRTSIACMIMWPGAPVRISHYFGGDIHWNFEKQLRIWTGMTGTRVVGDYIPTMKLSHHGAKDSTPKEVLRGWNPRNLIAQVSEQNSHPSWELLFFLHAWIHTGSAAKLAHKSFMPTQYPYYLIRMRDARDPNAETWMPLKGGAHSLATTNLTVASPLADQYFDDLDAEWETAQECWPDQEFGFPKYDWLRAKHYKQDLDAKDWVRNRIQEFWDDISEVPPGSHSGKGGDRLTGSWQFALRRQHLQWYRTISADSDPLDGAVYVIYENDKDEELMWPSKRYVPPTIIRQNQDFIAAPIEPPMKKQRIYSNFPVYEESDEEDDEMEEWVNNDDGSVLPNNTPQQILPGTNPEENDMSDYDSEEELALGNDDDDPPSTFPLPTPGGPILAPPKRAFPSLISPYYYICASTAEFTGPIDTKIIKQLIRGNPLNTFLSSLHIQGILLKDIPIVTEYTPFHDQDEFQNWLSVCLGVGKTTSSRVKLAAKVEPATGNVLEFTLDVPAWGYRYDSAVTAHVLDPEGEAEGWGLSHAGTVPPQRLMILGLQHADKGAGVTLDDILAPAYDRKAAMLNLQLFSLALGSRITFTVDVSEGSRSAIWLDPSSNYRVLARTQFVAEPLSLDAMNNWIQGFLTDFRFTHLTIITKLKCVFGLTKEEFSAQNDFDFTLWAEFELGGLPLSPHTRAVFDFNKTSLVLTFQFDYDKSEKESFMVAIMKWILKQECFRGAQFLFSDWLEKAGKSNFDIPLFRRLRMTIDLDPATGFPTGSIHNLQVDLELGLKFGRTTVDPQNIVFLFTYSWNSIQGSALRGILWTPPPPEVRINRRLHYAFEEYLQFEPATVSIESWALSLDLTNLIPYNPDSGAPGEKILRIPDGVPTQVTSLVLQIDAKRIIFDGGLSCSKPTKGTIPFFWLGQLDLMAMYTFKTEKAAPVFNMNLRLGATLFPEPTSGLSPLQITGGVKYDSSQGWAANAEIESVETLGAHLLRYFDKETARASTSLIQHIRLNYLRLLYQYQNTSDYDNASKDFFFTGSMSIGLMELALDFHYSSDDGWKFSAHVGADTESGPCTIQEILDSIVGDRTVILPTCVGSIIVDPPKVPAGPLPDGKAGELFTLILQKLNTNNGIPRTSDAEAQDVLVTLSVSVGPVSFTFLQYRNTGWPVEKTPPKRFLRLQVDQLPEVNVPLIGNLTQPFDRAYFMWVQDGSKSTTAGSPSGFTKAEIEILNVILDEDPMFYKLNKPEEEYKPTDVLIEAGCHFVVVLKDTKEVQHVVLDYVFAKPTLQTEIPSPLDALRYHASLMDDLGEAVVVRSPPYPQDAENDSEDVEPAAPEPNPADVGGGTTKVAMVKKTGPFSISNIGLRFSNSVLSICLDAAVTIGPIAMTMFGFSINLDFKGRDIQKNFPYPGNGMSLSLDGLIVNFQRSPLTIGGGLLHEKTDTSDVWAGGVDVGFVPWSFLAAGAYGEITDPITKAIFKTVFIFAQLNGPLVTLEFATISGITGGFGYNNSIKLPSVVEVPSFPFLHMPSVPGGSTMDTLTALLGSKWFSPQNESFWIAAGLTVTAFEMLEIKAVAVVEWDPEVKLGLFAVAVADVPSTKSSFKIAHVEMGILAMVDFGKGLAKFEAQLAPSSYILDPSCSLQGGFALYYWFKDGEQQTKGDFVFTIGGYHQFYTPLPQYPVPPRLQISWSLGPLSILGQAYFAITPKACMAGGLLHASLRLGVLEAFLDAYADFLINYNPFAFMAGGGVTVGVRFTLDLLFVTIHISIEIGATLFLQGPPLSGVAHVDFWIFGFDIYFGSRVLPNTGPVFLVDFYHLVLQEGSPSAMATPPLPHIFNCQSGLIPGASTPAQSQALAPLKIQPDVAEEKQIWAVSSGTLSFTISAVFALSTVIVYPDSENPITYNAPGSETSPIFSRPMKLKSTAMKSTLLVTFQILTSTFEREVLDIEPRWELRPVIKSNPRALWDKYNPADDPWNGSRALLDPSDPTLPLMMGIEFIPPPPQLSADKIPAFDAVKSQFSNVMPPVPFANSTAQEDAAWIPQEPVVPPPSEPALPWEVVQEWWETPKMGAGAGGVMADAWIQGMGWASGSVSGDVPERLVENLTGEYVAAPLVAVVL